VVAAAQELSLSNVQHLDLDRTPLACQSERVAVDEAGRDHRLALDRALDRGDAVAQACRLLEVLGVRRVLHARTQRADQVAGPAAQEQDRPADEVVVGLVADQPDAGCGAAADRVLDAGPTLAPVALEAGIRTGAQRKDPLQLAQGVAQRVARGVGTEVDRPIAREAPRLPETGIRLARVDLEAEVVLVVAQPHVVARAVLLDQLVLEEQRLLDARGDDHLDVVDARYQKVHLLPTVSPRAKIGAYARPQALGLADVEDRPARAAEQIDAGLGRERGDALEQARFGIAGRVAHRRRRRPRPFAGPGRDG
jgi:hypothetical protein